MKTFKALLINYPIGQMKLKKNVNLLWALSRQQKRYCLLTPRAICKYVTAGSNCVLSGARNVRNIVMGTVEVGTRNREYLLSCPAEEARTEYTIRSRVCYHHHVVMSRSQDVKMSTC